MSRAAKAAHCLFKVLNPCLQLHKGVSLATNVLLAQILGFQHPHLQHALMPASMRNINNQANSALDCAERRLVHKKDHVHEMSRHIMKRAPG